jgi:uncharacterized coiled-coil protein SlyX
MENEPAKQETEIEALARMVKAGFDRMDTEFAGVRGEMTAGSAAVNKRIDHLDTRVGSVEKGLQGLSYKVDQLDAKVEKYHHETKTDIAALRGVVGGFSHTLTDHEDRIKALEGE